MDPRLRTCLTKEDWVGTKKNGFNWERRPLNMCVTGVFMGITRDSIELLIEELGGKKQSGISGKTDYLITGYKLEDGRDFTEGGKYNKAKDKNIPCLNEEEFEEFVRK